ASVRAVQDRIRLPSLARRSPALRHAPRLPLAVHQEGLHFSFRTALGKRTADQPVAAAVARAAPDTHQMRWRQAFILGSLKANLEDGSLGNLVRNDQADARGGQVLHDGPPKAFLRLAEKAPGNLQVATVTKGL